MGGEGLEGWLDMEERGLKNEMQRWREGGEDKWRREEAIGDKKIKKPGHKCEKWLSSMIVSLPVCVPQTGFTP